LPACDEGHGTLEARASAVLAETDLEAWLPNYLGGHFLPTTPNSMTQINS